MSLGKTKRFKVFERDNYTCRYCGQKPPEVKLEVDHFIPRSKEGSDDMINLLTSCFDCNRGKRDRVVMTHDQTLEIETQIENKKEVILQLKQLNKLNDKVRKMQDEIVEEITLYWEFLWDDEKTFTAKGQSSIRTFLKYFTKNEIREAMDIARQQDRSNVDTFKYMCGILQNWKNGVREKTSWQQQ